MSLKKDCEILGELYTEAFWGRSRQSPPRPRRPQPPALPQPQPTSPQQMQLTATTSGQPNDKQQANSFLDKITSIKSSLMRSNVDNSIISELDALYDTFNTFYYPQ